MENTAVMATEVYSHSKLPPHGKALSWIDGLPELCRVENEGPKTVGVASGSSFPSLDVLRTVENSDIIVNPVSVLKEEDLDGDNNRSNIIPVLSSKGGLCGRQNSISENPKHELNDEYGHLVSGFDLVSSSLVRLRENIDRVQKRAKRPTTEEIEESKEEEPREEILVTNGIKRNPAETNEKTQLLVSKISFFVKEVKRTRSEVSFMKKWCSVMEEENKKLNDRMRAATADEEDMVRLQLEVLLAEKSRLANENAELTRDNNCLQQLLEYLHSNSQQPQLSEDEHSLDSKCLDFSSP